MLIEAGIIALILYKWLSKNAQEEGGTKPPATPES
jgi:hypothetical protein